MFDKTGLTDPQIVTGEFLCRSIANPDGFKVKVRNTQFRNYPSLREESRKLFLEKTFIITTMDCEYRYAVREDGIIINANFKDRE